MLTDNIDIKNCSGDSSPTSLYQCASMLCDSCSE